MKYIKSLVVTLLIIIGIGVFFDAMPYSVVGLILFFAWGTVHSFMYAKDDTDFSA